MAAVVAQASSRALSAIADETAIAGKANILASQVQLLAASRSSDRAARWSALEYCLNVSTSVLHVGSILAFLVLIPAVWLGWPYDMPAYIGWVCCSITVLSLLSIALSTAKRAYLGLPQVDSRPLKPTRKEVVATVVFSTVCICVAVYVNLYSRGTLAWLLGRTHGSNAVDYQQFVVVWLYYVFNYVLLQMYGLIVGVGLLIVLFTGFCCACCCNCCFRGPIFAWLRQAGRTARRLRQKNKKEKYVSTAGAGGLQRRVSVLTMTTDDEWRPMASAVVVGDDQPTVGGGTLLYVSRHKRGPQARKACLAYHATALTQPPELPSRDGAEPIIDFVENKTQITWLSPCIFVYAFAMGATLVMCGSALIGPEHALPTAPGAPTTIRALCRAPVTGYVQDALGRSMGGKYKLAFVGLHLVWTTLLEPPAELCADVVVRENVVLQRAMEAQQDLDLACPLDRQQMPPPLANALGMDCSALLAVRALGASANDIDPFMAFAMHVPVAERAAQWRVAAALPSRDKRGAGGASAEDAVQVPPLVFAVQDEVLLGVPKTNIETRILRFTGTCVGGGQPTLVNGTSSVTTDYAGVAVRAAHNRVGVLTLY